MTRDELWYKAMDIGAAAGCHQRPERSFFLGEYQFPVCARCTGVFVGHIAALIMLICGKKPPALLSAALIAVMGADWLVQYKGIRESTNPRRFVTGIMGGMGIILLWSWFVSVAVNSVRKLFGKQP